MGDVVDLLCSASQWLLHCDTWSLVNDSVWGDYRSLWKQKLATRCGHQEWKFEGSVTQPRFQSQCLSSLSARCDKWLAFLFSLILRYLVTTPFQLGWSISLATTSQAECPHPLSCFTTYLSYILSQLWKHNTQTWVPTWYIDNIRILSLQWPHCLCTKRNWGSRKITCLGNQIVSLQQI